MRKIFYIFFFFLCVALLSACNDFGDITSDTAVINYKIIESQIDDETHQEKEVEIIKKETINFNDLSNHYHKYTSIEFKINNTSEMDSSCGFDLWFSTLSSKDVNFTFEITNGFNTIYSQNISLTNDNEYKFNFYYDELKISLNAGDNIFFNFINLDEEIKVYDIIILGKDSEIDDDELYNDDELYPDEEGDLNP